MLSLSSLIYYECHTLSLLKMLWIQAIICNVPYDFLFSKAAKIEPEVSVSDRVSYSQVAVKEAAIKTQ